MLTIIFISAKNHFPERIEGLAFVQNDCEYFLDPVDVYFERGQMELRSREGIPFAGRMPGYAAPYFVLRLFFQRETALSLLIMLQIFLSAAAVVIMAWLASQWFSNRRYFLPVLLILLFSFHLFVFDFFTLSESLAVSAFCFFLYYLHRYQESSKHAALLQSGFFMAWLIFLRPFTTTLLILFPLLLLVNYLKHQLSMHSLLKAGLLFLIPFFVFEAAWVYRNYRVLGKWVPLETSITESYGERGAYRTSAVAIRKLISAWGGQTGEFYAGSEAEWFHHTEMEKADDYVFKPHVFKATFNKDSLLELKKIFNMSIDSTLSDAEKDSLNMLAAETALRWADDYRSKNPLRFYMINPLKRLSYLMTSNATMLIPFPAFSRMNLLEKIIKIFSVLLYYLLTVSGTAGSCIYLFLNGFGKPVPALAALAPWILIFTIVLASDIMQFRYILAATPVWAVFSVYLAELMLKKLRIKLSS